MDDGNLSGDGTLQRDQDPAGREPRARGTRTADRHGARRNRFLDVLRIVLQHQRRGERVSYPTFLRPMYVVYTPELVRRIFLENPDNYVKESPLQQAVHEVTESLWSHEGESWQKLRRALQPSFMRRSLAEHSPVIQEAALDMLTQWERSARQGEAVDVWKENKALIARILVKVLFGRDLGPEAASMARAMTLIGRAVHSPGDPEGQEAVARVRDLCRSILQDHTDPSLPHRGVVSDFLAGKDGVIHELPGSRVGDVFGLLEAGIETTTNALTWAWYLLDRHPEARARMEAEVDGALPDRDPLAADLGSIPFTRMVFQEAMRLYPPVWLMGRRTVHDDEVDGDRIPGGAAVGVCPYAMHRNPEYWPEPDAFDPDRFHPDAPTDRPGLAYIPFGSGRRRCLGENLAMMEGPMILATVARRYRMELVPGQALAPQPGFNLRPNGPVLMVPVPRAAGGDAPPEP